MGALDDYMEKLRETDPEFAALIDKAIEEDEELDIAPLEEEEGDEEE